MKARTIFALNFLVVGAILSAILLASLPGWNIINTAVSGSMAGGVVLYLVINRKKLYNSVELMMILAWLAYALIPSIFAPDQEQAMFKAISMLQVMVLVYLIVQVMVWNGSTRPFLWAYIIAMCLSYLVTFTGLNAYIQEISSAADVAGGGETLRTTGTLANAVTFGVAAVMAQGLIVVLLTHAGTSTIEKLLAIIAFIILTGATINSGSRTALVGSGLLLLGSAWVFSLWRPERFIRFLFASVIFAGVGAAFVFAVKDIEQVSDRYYEVIESGAVTSRMTDFFAMITSSDDVVERSGQSLEERLGLAKMAWEIANQYPLGVGLDNFSEFSGVYAHSNYLELLATTGFPGLLIYYLCYLFMLSKSFKIWAHMPNPQTAKAVILAIFVLALMDIQNVSYYVKTVWIYLAILIATLEVYRRALIHQARQAQQAVAARQRAVTP